MRRPHTLRSPIVLLVTAMCGVLLVPNAPAIADHLGQRLLSAETPNGLDDYPVVSPDGNWVIFPANRDGVFDLWRVSTANPGATPVKVNPPEADDHVASWHFSPDSQYIIYTGNYEADPTLTALYSRPADLSTPATRLSEHSMSNTGVSYDVVVSPDSQLVVYRGNLTSSGRNDLYSRPIDGSGSQVRLTSDPTPGGEVNTGFTEVTPDSTMVVFKGDMDAVDVTELYSAPIDQAAGQAKLNDDPVTDGDVSFYEISGDSSRVVYRGDLDTDLRLGLYSAPIGIEDQQITLSEDSAGGTVNDHELAGDTVVYRGDMDVLNKFELYRRPIDGSLPQTRVNSVIADDSGDAGASFTVSPDGSRVAYMTRPDDTSGYTVYSRLVDLSQPEVQVSSTAPGSGSAEGVGFTHDSSRLVYTGTLVSDGNQIFSAPADGSGPQVQLSTATSGDVGAFGVAPDDTRVVYRADITTPGTVELFSAPIATSGQQVPVSSTATPDGDAELGEFLPDSSAVVYVGDLTTNNLDELWISDGGQLPPVAPGLPSATGVSGNTITLMWTPPSSQTDDFTVTATPSGGAPGPARGPDRTATVASTVTATVDGTSTTLEGLEPATEYSITVRANNHVGAGGTSPAVEVVTLDTADGVARLSGGDRYTTAVEVALDRFDPADVDTVYLATGTNFPDALAGGPLAAQDGAPILLVRPDSLPLAVGDALEALAPTKVIAFGGAKAVSNAVLDAAATAAGGATTDRISGLDRYATAAAIAQAMDTAGVDTTYVATGTNFPDALAGGPATGGAPILLTRPDSLPAATMIALGELAPDNVVALGGTAAVTNGTLAAAADAAGSGTTTSRLSGADRYATATAIADEFGNVDTVYVAVGRNFPDALAAGPAASAEGAPIVLTATSTLSTVTSEYLDALTGLRRIVILGGTSAVSAEVSAALTDLLD